MAILFVCPLSRLLAVVFLGGRKADEFPMLYFKCIAVKTGSFCYRLRLVCLAGMRQKNSLLRWVFFIILFNERVSKTKMFPGIQIIESFRLEKTFKIMKSNRTLTLPSPPLSLFLGTTSTYLLNTSRDGDSTTSLGSLFQCLITLSVKKFSLISSLNLPWRNLRPFPLVLSLVTWEKRPTPTSLQPPFRLNNPMRGPKLNTALEVRPQQCQGQGHNHFPSLAGHTIPDTSQDAIGLLGHLGTLLAHIQLAVDQHPQVLFHRAAFQPLFPKPIAFHGVVVTQVQDPALSLVESHTAGPSPSIQPVQVPLQSLPTLKQINTPTQLGVICKVTEGVLDPPHPDH
ncbi:hypothetical protein QYF61_012970 [Mycteria americana]|uniref:Uncharacterized protein n=1 Tax=Mycteria americana TaxID=33587 RepID=A0AAN7PHF2_MYCAM|nr:hypothetical protein QYF61_012970 [Mycteria americana]